MPAQRERSTGVASATDEVPQFVIPRAAVADRGWWDQMASLPLAGARRAMPITLFLHHCR
jgi:hypothetical protein